MIRHTTQEERNVIADALGDSPETTIPAHLLRRGIADGYVIGAGPLFDGVVVRSRSLPQEPWCFGTDPASIWELLSPLDDWRRQRMSPNVSAGLAEGLARLIEDGVSAEVHFYGDVYHTLTGPVNEVVVPDVRRLGLDDVPLLAAYRDSAQDTGFASFEDLLTDGLAAGAVVENRLVALAHTNAVTARHADIGVETSELWRCRGFASASASIVALGIQRAGRIPVWSAGEDSHASLRVATKLGFSEVSRRIYLKICPRL